MGIIHVLLARVSGFRPCGRCGTVRVGILRVSANCTCRRVWITTGMPTTCFNTQLSVWNVFAQVQACLACAVAGPVHAASLGHTASVDAVVTIVTSSSMSSLDLA